MKILSLVQGSKEWHDLKRVRLGMSQVAAICGVDPYRSPADIWDEMILGKVKPMNHFMQAGRDREVTARDFYNRVNLADYQPIVCVNDKYPWLMASLDGWWDKTVLEIKSPGEKTWSKLQASWEWDNPQINAYIYQISGQMCISEAATGHLFVYMDDERNDDIIIGNLWDIQEEILDKTKTFYDNHILTFTRPD